MATDEFFDVSSKQSQIKSDIVAKYFYAWATIITNKNFKKDKTIYYVDLFAGPGRYKDNSISTPLKVLKSIIENKKLKEHVCTIFNDIDQKKISILEKEIQNISGIEILAHKPQIRNQPICEEIVEQFSKKSFLPSFFFIDPWGYKGLSLKLINSVIKDWGCDCVFFFNYNRVNMGINNSKVEKHINALFGKEIADNLRKRIKNKRPSFREKEIMKSLYKSLNINGNKFQHTFRFFNEKGIRTSHYLIFVSNNSTAYKIMKDVMGKMSSRFDYGVPSYEFKVGDSENYCIEDRFLIDELKKDLLIKYSGMELKFKKLFDDHHVGKPYIERNYKDVLIELEEEDVIKADPPIAERPKRQGLKTFGDRVIVSFPKV